MTVVEKIDCIDDKEPTLSVSRQCDLLRLASSSYYRPLIERLWCSVKYEKIFLGEFETVAKLLAGLKEYVEFYNFERPHQLFSGKTHAEIYWDEEVAKMAA